MSPSLSKSAPVMPLHHPPVLERPVEFVTSSNFPFIFLKNRMGINSPERIRSNQPSLLKSLHNDAVTIPGSTNSGLLSLVTSVKKHLPFFVSFLSKKLCGE